MVLVADSHIILIKFVHSCRKYSGMRFLLIILFIFFFSIQSRATHIIGGEITYTYLGNDKYHITLKVYRDCFHGVPPFDAQAAIGIFDSSNVLLKTLYIPFPGSKVLKPVLNTPCLTVPPDICVEEAIYEAVVLLPPIPGGYQLAYQRCCRNNSINNIISPGGTGATYYIIIKDTTVVKTNSSPYFNNFPPILICQNEPLIFDHSATDPDGDSLVYSICLPYNGADSINPMPQPPYNPPYPYVQWKSPYSTNDPMGGIPLTINPQTGLLTGTPNTIGQFVIGICVEEFRNGVLLSTNKRDFQFNVRYCPPVPTVSVPSFKIHCGNSPVIFNNTSINAISYDWDFGILGISTDTSTIPDPKYTFPDTGSYNVRLIVNKNFSCADTTYTTVTVSPNAKAAFNFSNACVNNLLPFHDSSTVTGGWISKWFWQFGDGKSDTLQNPSHMYDFANSYNVTLIATSNKGCKDTVVKTAIAYDLPVPNFNNPVVCNGQPVAFTDSSTIKNDTIINWLWDFGDGTNSSSKNPKHGYPIGNVSYNVTLTTGSNHACFGTITKPLTFNPLPLVNFNVGNDCRNKKVPFTNLSTISKGALVKWQWDFGDFVKDSLKNTQHAYAAAQNYTVKLVAISDFGCKDSLSKTNTIYPKPAANFTHNNQCSNYSNSFNDSSYVSGNDINSWKWNFGDGSTSQVKNPTHIYTTDSTYIASITVTTSKGCIDSIKKNVNVYPAPDASFLTTSPKGCIPFNTSFSPLVTKDSIGTYIWNFGDGSTSTGMHPIHQYKNSGSYSVSLKVISSQGCKDSSTANGMITIYPLPKADFTLSPEETTLDFPTIVFKDKSTGARQWEWNFGDISPIDFTRNPTHNYNDTGFFKIILMAINEFSCTDTASDYVYIKPTFTFYVPNAITANNDGTNEIFYGYGTGILQYELLIFNRWGEKIFETHNLYEGWDATFQNRLVQEDIYVYYITLRDVFKKTHRYVGSVSVIR